MRALIVKTSALGDIVQTYPVVEYLKKRQHVDHIGWVVEEKFASLVKAHPGVDEVVGIDASFLRGSTVSWNCVSEFLAQRQKVQSSRWDVLFDLQGNCKSGLYTFFAHSSHKVGYGLKSVAEWPNILVTNRRSDPPRGLSTREEYVWMVRNYFHDEESFEPSHVSLKLSSSEERMLAQEILRWPEQKPVWMLAVGSHWVNKMCCSKTFKELLHLIRQKYDPYFVFVAGNGEELKEVGFLAGDLCSSSHVMFKPELPVLQRVMGRAQAVIAVDSLLLHLAATTGTPTFGFFGPSLGEKYAPRGKHNGYFQGLCPYNIPFEKRCPFLRTCEDGLCLKGPENVTMFQALDEWYGRSVQCKPGL